MKRQIQHNKLIIDNDRKKKKEEEKKGSHRFTIQLQQGKKNRRRRMQQSKFYLPNTQKMLSCTWKKSGRVMSAVNRHEIRGRGREWAKKTEEKYATYISKNNTHTHPRKSRSRGQRTTTKTKCARAHTHTHSSLYTLSLPFLHILALHAHIANEHRARNWNMLCKIVVWGKCCENKKRNQAIKETLPNYRHYNFRHVSCLPQQLPPRGQKKL